MNYTIEFGIASERAVVYLFGTLKFGGRSHHGYRWRLFKLRRAVRKAQKEKRLRDAIKSITKKKESR